MLNPEIVAIYEKYPQGANDPACVAEIDRYLEEHLGPLLQENKRKLILSEREAANIIFNA